MLYTRDGGGRMKAWRGIVWLVSLFCFQIMQRFCMDRMAGWIHHVPY